MHKVTIITATYKRPKELERAIKSVNAQTFEEWEHIIVSDGKSQKNREVVDKYADKRRKYVEIPHSGSDAKPKNEAIRQAQGEYIAYLDDDNEYLPNFLEIMLTEAEIGGEDILYADMRIFKKGDEEGKQAIALDYDAQFLLNRSYIDNNSVIHKKECVEYIGGWNEDLPRFKDWNLFVRMSKAGFKFKHIPVYLTKYHITKGNSAEKHPVKSWEDPQTGMTMFDPTYFSPSSCKIWVPCLGTKEPDSKIAVFTLTKEREQYTINTLNSAFDSTRYPFDWYIVDNGSQDETIKKIKNWAKKREIPVWEQRMVQKRTQGKQRSQSKNKRNKEKIGDSTEREESLVEGWEDKTCQRLCSDKSVESSACKEIYNGASTCHGETSWTLSGTTGGSTSYKRKKRRQSSTEPKTVQKSKRTQAIRNIYIIKNKKNVGISKASNQVLDIIEKGKYDIIMKVDNDVLFLTKGWLKDFVDLWKRNHKLYIGPYPEGLVDSPGGAWRVGVATIGKEYVEVCQHIPGMCTFIDARAYKDFRWKDKFLHGNQDMEFSEHARKQGYMPCIFPKHRVQHMNTRVGQEKDYPEYFELRKYEKTHEAPIG
jgi:glycosyltransferase involved in cell wall biosynthesis